MKIFTIFMFYFSLSVIKMKKISRILGKVGQKILYHALQNRGGHGGMSMYWENGRGGSLTKNGCGEYEDKQDKGVRGGGGRDRAIRGAKGDKKETTKNKENYMNRGRKEGGIEDRDHMKGDNSKGEWTRRGRRRNT